jgi:hypothetical protein
MCRAAGSRDAGTAAIDFEAQLAAAVVETAAIAGLLSAKNRGLTV